jgi:hypothetical protein
MTEPLVNRLLNDVGANPDQLPILQHALMRTWDEWRRPAPEHAAAHAAGPLIDVCCYEAIGGMSDALSRHAEEAYDELPDERARRLAEHLFKALTERGPDNREIRRPTRLKEICEIAGASPEEVSAVVEVFRSEGRSFLMPPAGVALGPDTVIDISHESLIRNWGRLREWVKDEAGRMAMKEVPGSEFTLDCDLCFLAMGFVGPEQDGPIKQLGVSLDQRGNVVVDDKYATNVPGVFAAGDMRRGQSLVVWAISEGRQAARAVDEFLMGRSDLPYMKLF